MFSERLDRFFKSDDDKMRETEQIVSLLKNSPHVEELQRERDQNRLARVHRLLAERAQTQSERAKAMQSLEVAVAESKETEARAYKSLQAATQERIKAEQARFGATVDFSLKLSTLEAEIKKNAPKEIDEFISEMLKADEKARLEYKTEQRPGSQARLTGQVTSTIFNSNKKAIDDKRAYLKTTIAAAEAMKLQAISYDQIVARLVELKAGIPESHRFESVEVPLPDVHELRR